MDSEYETEDFSTSDDCDTDDSKDDVNLDDDLDDGIEYMTAEFQRGEGRAGDELE